MKNLKKILGICLIILIAMFTISSIVYAADDHAKNIFSKTYANKEGLDKVNNAGNNIVSTIRIVGMIVSVGILMVLGVKYMMGSAEEKAEYKKTMIPYLVGAILIFAATFILTGIEAFADSIKW